MFLFDKFDKNSLLVGETEKKSHLLETDFPELGLPLPLFKSRWIDCFHFTCDSFILLLVANVFSGLTLRPWKCL
jgi:hypothetical protein